MSKIKVPYRCDTMKFLENYYEERFPEELELDEQLKLIAEAQSGNIDSQNKLVESLIKFIYGIARSNWRPKSELDDIFQVGIIGCIKAISTFKADLNAQFLTYATPVINNTIRNYLRDLKLNYDIVSLSEPMFINENGDEIYLLDLLISDELECDVERYVEMITMKEIVLSELDKLPDRERVMIEYRFGLNGKPQLTNEKIGKLYGCSKQRINKLTNEALIIIRRNIECSLH